MGAYVYLRIDQLASLLVDPGMEEWMESVCRAVNTDCRFLLVDAVDDGCDR